MDNLDNSTSKNWPKNFKQKYVTKHWTYMLNWIETYFDTQGTPQDRLHSQRFEIRKCNVWWKGPSVSHWLWFGKESWLIGFKRA